MTFHILWPPLSGAVMLFMLLGTAPAGANDAGRPNKAHDPAISPGTPAYRSVFNDYGKADSVTLADWRAVNDTVEKVGGFAGALRGDAGDPLPPPAAASGKEADRAGGHHHHHKH